MTVSEWITLGSVLAALISSALTVYVKSKQTRLELEVETAKVTAVARIDETKTILEAWKEINTGHKVEIASLKSELKDERTQHQQCARQAARQEGQLAALLNAQPQYAPDHTNRQPTEMKIENATVENVTLTNAEENAK